jgi:hypothetical protein
MNPLFNEGDKVRVRNWSGVFWVSSRMDLGKRYLYYIREVEGERKSYMQEDALTLVERALGPAQLTIF